VYENDSNNSQTPDFPHGLAKPAIRALLNSDITRLEQLPQFTEAEVSQLHGIGPNAIVQLRKALELKELSFKPVE
jgi:hypothetical protein